MATTKRISEKKTNWFKRHLNWTYIFGLFIGGALFNGGQILVEFGDRLVGLIELWIGAIFLLVVTIWAIKQKGRSLAFILWGLLGILPIIVLCMKNKTEERKRQAEEWDRRNKEIWEKEHGVGGTGKE